MSAVSAGDIQLVKLLVNKSADVNIKNKYGWSPWMSSLRSVKVDDQREIAKLLISKGAEVPSATALLILPADVYLATLDGRSSTREEVLEKIKRAGRYRVSGPDALYEFPKDKTEFQNELQALFFDFVITLTPGSHVLTIYYNRAQRTPSSTMSEFGKPISLNIIALEGHIYTINYEIESSRKSWRAWIEDYGASRSSSR